MGVGEGIPKTSPSPSNSQEEDDARVSERKIGNACTEVEVGFRQGNGCGEGTRGEGEGRGTCLTVDVSSCMPEDISG